MTTAQWQVILALCRVVLSLAVGKQSPDYHDDLSLLHKTLKDSGYGT